jgi:hypothetical protein
MATMTMMTSIPVSIATSRQRAIRVGQRRFLQGDEATVHKEHDEQHQQQVEEENSLRDAEKAESVAQRNHSSSVALPSDGTKGSGHDNDATAMTNGHRMLTTTGRGFSFTSPEARQAFGEIWNDMERQQPPHDSLPLPDPEPPPRIDPRYGTDFRCTRQTRRKSRLRRRLEAAIRLLTTPFNATSQRLTIVSRQHAKKGLISASLTSTGSIAGFATVATRA